MTELERTNTSTILIVEADGIVAKDIERILTTMGYAVPAIAATHERALVDAKRCRPDLILMAVGLAATNEGLETVRALRAQSDVPIVFLTSAADRQSLERAKLAEPDAFVHEPFDERALLAAIEVAPYKHAMERRLRESERRYRELVESVHDVIYSTDAAGRISYMSPTVQRATGFQSEDLVGRLLLDLVHPDFRDKMERTVSGSIELGSEDFYSEFPVLTKNGAVVWFGQTVRIDRDSAGAMASLRGVARDVTERRAIEERLRHTADQLSARNRELRQLSITDDLTGLYNRRGFMTLAEQLVKGAIRSQRTCLLFFVDVDGLKRINDAYGHEEGNTAIVRTADILRDSFRAIDVIGRLGGDEFVVMTLVSADHDEEVIRRRIESKLADDNALHRGKYELEFSLGVHAFTPTGPTSIDTIVAEADVAMYEHKRRRTLTASSIVALER